MPDSLRRLLVLAMPALVWIGSQPALGRAQEADDDDPFLPGLIANFRDDKGHSAARLDPQLAFHWSERPPDPRLSAGEFRATWQGHLLVTTSGDYRFLVFGSGEVELKIAGRVAIARQTMRETWLASEPVKLSADYHSLEMTFRRTKKDARLMLLWSGPDFGREPVPSRSLYHPREKPIGRGFERGRLLARVLRCGRCHAEEQPPRPAPALERPGGNLSRGWLVHWLAAGEHDKTEAGARSPRRMPAFGLSDAQAEAVADYLLSSRGEEHPAPVPPPMKKPPKKPGKNAPKPPPPPSAKTGERLFLTLGCLACHTWRDVGASGWLGGGDLTHIADKRPPGFFAAWLADPSQLNRDHRMPVFPLSAEERLALSLFLAEQKTKGEKGNFNSSKSTKQIAEGRKLVELFRCAACHRLPESAAEKATPAASRLDARSNWERSCMGTPDAAKHRPGYRLSKGDADALRLYYTGARSPQRDGRLLLAEHNCLACHAREGTRETIPLLPPLLADKLTAVGKRYPDLAPLLPALTPPALNSVGDKLTDSALVESIARRGEAHRPYLHVRLPRFPLPDEDLQSLMRYLIDADRVPPRPTDSPAVVDRVRQDRYI
ncbi:MAG TPA: c-type cytochrome, partial [Gemmataceae bacterium]